MAPRKNAKVLWDQSNPIQLTVTTHPRFGAQSRATKKTQIVSPEGLELSLSCLKPNGKPVKLIVHMALGYFNNSKGKDYRAPFVSISISDEETERWWEAFAGELATIPASVEKLLEENQPGVTQRPRTDYDFVSPPEDGDETDDEEEENDDD